ncbi:MAG: putative DNA binding domain-containing protein [Acidimicrobiaceae bacterium]|nr:putative DNA binding domain-containing protein [Acidimicrobiaceae bacterium]
MNRTDLLEIIAGGENSHVEFKRDSVQPSKLAAEMAALLNLEGGYVLLGIDDDGTVPGLTRDPSEAERWVMQAAKDNLQPAAIPVWQEIEWAPGSRIGVIALPMNAPDKPYKVRQGSAWVTKVRAGTTTRDASREEEQRLYQQAGGLRYGLKPVTGARLVDLDHRRLRDYFGRIRGDADCPDPGSVEWEQLLRNLEFATAATGGTAATIDGMLLFGSNVGRFLPQSGIRAVCYEGSEQDYAARADEDIKGSLVPLGASDGSISETGVVDRAVDFVHRYTSVSAHLEGGRRVDRRDYPAEAVREVVVNSLVHRDYSIEGTDVMLSIFSDRLEIQSPGRLPNTVTVAGMRSGVRYSRNQTLANVLRDYGYVDARGMGIRNKVIPSMAAHNGTEPEFIEDDYRLTVRLWK